MKIRGLQKGHEVHNQLCGEDLESMMGIWGLWWGDGYVSWLVGSCQGMSGEMVRDRDRLHQGAVMCFLLLSLFLPSHSPLCCDLSSGIQVNKCHIFQPIFTPGNVPSPSPLCCCSCFCYHCNRSPPTLPNIP